MPSDKREQTKYEIITAAVECIDEFGIKGATIRKIADKAGVNSAAISYYFGSRDDLINIAMESTLDNAFDFTDFVYPKNADYKTVLKSMFEHWRHGTVSYPGITRAHFEDIMAGSGENKTTLTRIKKFLDDTYELLTAHGLEKCDANYKKLNLVFGAFIATVLMPDAMYPEGCDDEIEILSDMI